MKAMNNVINMEEIKEKMNDEEFVKQLEDYLKQHDEQLEKAFKQIAHQNAFNSIVILIGSGLFSLTLLAAIQYYIKK